jgi:hypothetical protein
MLSAKKPSPERDYSFGWYRQARLIQEGEAGYQVRQLVSDLLQPRLRVARHIQLFEEQDDTLSGGQHEESLHHFLRVDFEPAERVNPDDIVDKWPATELALVRLVQKLERSLLDALELAEDVGFTIGYDRSDSDVPSVARHHQNQYRAGFYPIIRVMADLWERLAQASPGHATALTRSWREARFLLIRRLGLFAVTNTIHPPSEMLDALMALDDHDFWVSGAQVEIMKGLVARWDEFDPAARAQLEGRITAGMPRDIFEDGAFDEERWQAVRDNATYRRLSRLVAAGKALSQSGQDHLAEIAQRHPNWAPSLGDRDDFHSWSETRTGPDGDVELLKDVPEERLLGEALRIEQERQFEQSDLWRQFCSSDPTRALRALLAEATVFSWNAYAWRSLLWATGRSFENDLRAEIAVAIVGMPEATIGELASTVADWIRTHREYLAMLDHDGSNLLWVLWDRLATIVYADTDDLDVTADDLVDRALNLPGGELAWTLLDHLLANNSGLGSGLGSLEPRFLLVVRSESEAGLLGRVHFARAINPLYGIAPEWTSAEMLPRFNEVHPEAMAMWKANSQAQIGSAALFNDLKETLLAVLTRPELSDNESGNLFVRIFNGVIWHQLGTAHEYNITTDDVRHVLAVGPERLRDHAAWLFWRLQADTPSDESEISDRGQRWRKLVGPVFRAIWPLDVRLRTKRSSENLVHMIMETDTAFDDAVDTVIDYLGPYKLYSLEHTFRLERAHAELVDRFPASIVKLANALIDPNLHPVPDDLGKLLDDCRRIEPSIADEDAFLRLDGFRRLSGA